VLDSNTDIVTQFFRFVEDVRLMADPLPPSPIVHIDSHPSFRPDVLDG